MMTLNLRQVEINNKCNMAAQMQSGETEKVESVESVEVNYES